MWWGNTKNENVYRIEFRGKELLRITDDEWNIDGVYVNDSRNAIVVSMIKKPTIIESEDEQDEQDK